MASQVHFANYVTIGKRTKMSDPVSSIGYSDVTDKMKRDIAENPNFHTVQINHSLPPKAYQVIDELLEVHPNITFRIYGLYHENHFDLDVLSTMKNLTRLRLDCISLAKNPRLLELEKLCKLKGLKSLTLELFDLKDYRFIRDLDKSIEELTVFADTVKGIPIFDSKWLLDFPELHTLYLGKKAKKNYQCIAKLPNLKQLGLRGIKIDNFIFLKETQLEELQILWASIENIDSLAVVKSLKHLELWRIPKLKDISVIEQLKNLESLKLQDLKYITAIPDISCLPKLKELILINIPISFESIPEQVKVKSWS